MKNEEIIANNKTYWDEHADLWFGTTALPVYGVLFPTEDDLHLFGDVKGKRMLELCCGSGHSLKYHAEKGAAELWGVDLSQKQLENAEKLLLDSGYAAKLICSKMEADLDVPKEYFDYVYSIYGIGWTTDLQGTFEKVASYEFDGFISLLNEKYQNDYVLTHYDNIAEECFVWIDYDNLCYVICWKENDCIRVRWYLEEERVNAIIQNSSLKKEGVPEQACNHDWRGNIDAGFIICYKCDAVLMSKDIKSKRGINLLSVEKAQIYWSLDDNLTARKSNGKYLYSENEAFSLVEETYGVTREYLKNYIWNGHAYDDYVKYYITAWKK